MLDGDLPSVGVLVYFIYYFMVKNYIAFLAFVLLYPAFGAGQVTGRVTSSEDGLPIYGVTVVAHHFGYAANTDEDGRFNIRAGLSANDMAKDTLIFRYTGFETQKIPIQGRYEIDVVLNPEFKVLREAVVTAIGVKKEKKRLAYSATEVTSDEIEKSNEVNIVNALNGKVAGVQITSSSGTPGASSSMVIRGYSSIDGSNQPLFIIDGVPIDNSYRGSNFTDQGNRALDLNPNDIENISVLKGGAATALYGYRAGNGVVMITTKKGKEGKNIGNENNKGMQQKQDSSQCLSHHPRKGEEKERAGGKRERRMQNKERKRRKGRKQKKKKKKKEHSTMFGVLSILS